MKWLAKVSNPSSKPEKSFREIGELGVNALKSATPKDTGDTSEGWFYKIEKKQVIFYNRAHPQTRIPVALLIQYGHGTKNGGYVPPIDYINPALESIFRTAGDLIAKEMYA